MILFYHRGRRRTFGCGLVKVFVLAGGRRDCFLPALLYRCRRCFSPLCCPGSWPRLGQSRSIWMSHLLYARRSLCVAAHRRLPPAPHATQTTDGAVPAASGLSHYRVAMRLATRLAGPVHSRLLLRPLENNLLIQGYLPRRRIMSTSTIS